MTRETRTTPVPETPATPTGAALDALREQIKARRDAVMQLTFRLAADGEKAFRMSIPMQQDDSDVLLLALCADVDALLAEHTALREENANAVRQVAQYAGVERDLRASHAALSTRLAVAEEALADATTPDIMGDDDGVGYIEEDFDCLLDSYPVGHIREVWANKQLGQRWIARVATSWEDDGSPDDFDVRVFDSRAAAEAAITAARRSPTTRGTNG